MTCFRKSPRRANCLCVDDSWSDQNLLAARNIARLAINEAKDINAYDLSRYDKVVLSEKGMEILLNRLQGDN
jgi:ribosomal protein L4